jgi:hypothetical protein
MRRLVSLTGVAARYTAERGPAFDIFLPEFVAVWNKTIFGALFFAGQLLDVVQLLRSGDRTATARQFLAMPFGGAAVALAPLSVTLRQPGAWHPRVIREALLAAGLLCAGAAVLRAMPVRSVGSNARILDARRKGGELIRSGRRRRE